jgi:hypothetical protein
LRFSSERYTDALTAVTESGRSAGRQPVQRSSAYLEVLLQVETSERKSQTETTQSSDKYRRRRRADRR